MKKLILTALLLMGISFAASAQVQVIYAQDISDGDVVYHPKYYIDRTAKKIYFNDPADPDVVANPQDYPPYIITSYTKEGNKETFQFTQENYPVQMKLVMIINPSLTNKSDLSSQTATLTASHVESADVSKVLLYEQLPDEEKQSIEYDRKFRDQEAARAGAAAPGSGGGDSTDPIDKLLDKGKDEVKNMLNDGVKNLLNKGKDLLKKK